MASQKLGKYTRGGVFALAVFLALVIINEVMFTTSPREAAATLPTASSTPTAKLVQAPYTTPTPVPCPTGCALDFSIGVDGYAGDEDDCFTATGGSTTCTLRLGATFRLNFYVNSLGSLPGYAGFDARLGFTGVITKGNPFYTWPSCVFPGRVEGTGFLAFGCAIGLGLPTSTFTGRMGFEEFKCNASGMITLMQGIDSTDLVDDADSTHYSEAGPDETITINCVQPAWYPGDTDGDGCPDFSELGTDPRIGGRRDYANPWDYFNPTGDGANRSDDLYAVAAHYGQDRGIPGSTYDTRYDRTPFIGSLPWQFGPPDGTIRSFDITAAVRSYGHDCS